MLHAGWDTSGTPDLEGKASGHNPYVIAIAGVTQPEMFSESLRVLRLRFSMGVQEEFHGHRMPEERIETVLQAASEAELVVGVLLIDKTVTRERHEASTWPAPADLQSLAALALLEQFFTRNRLVELRFDEEIKGKKREQEFITAVKRMHRAVWPDMRPKVQSLPSHKSDLIQLADVVAYVWGRWARTAIRSVELVRRLEAMRADTRHIILGPRGWES